MKHSQNYIKEGEVMKKIILDGSQMTSIKDTHKYIKIQLNFPLYYGENLDALWDILSTISDPTCITLINNDALDENLGIYAKLLIEVFCDAAKDNKKVHFLI